MRPPPRYGGDPLCYRGDRLAWPASSLERHPAGAHDRRRSGCCRKTSRFYRGAGRGLARRQSLAMAQARLACLTFSAESCCRLRRPTGTPTDRGRPRWFCRSDRLVGRLDGGCTQPGFEVANGPLTQPIGRELPPWSPLRGRGPPRPEPTTVRSWTTSRSETTLSALITWHSSTPHDPRRGWPPPRSSRVAGPDTFCHPRFPGEPGHRTQPSPGSACRSRLRFPRGQAAVPATGWSDECDAHSGALRPLVRQSRASPGESAGPKRRVELALTSSRPGSHPPRRGCRSPAPTVTHSTHS